MVLDAFETSKLLVCVCVRARELEKARKRERGGN